MKRPTEGSELFTKLSFFKTLTCRYNSDFVLQHWCRHNSTPEKAAWLYSVLVYSEHWTSVQVFAYLSYIKYSHKHLEVSSSLCPCHCPVLLCTHPVYPWLSLYIPESMWGKSAKPWEVLRSSMNPLSISFNIFQHLSRSFNIIPWLQISSAMFMCKYV